MSEEKHRYPLYAPNVVKLYDPKLVTPLQETARRELTRITQDIPALQIGDKVKESPVGAGTITAFTSRGYPRVNHVAVALLVREDDYLFDPHGTYDKWKKLNSTQDEKD